MKIKRIAIVGGGSAGWMAANHLGYELRQDPEIEITLIESPDLPIIGVGEGTVPLIKRSLQKFGIAEADLLAQCDATFKNGIKFSNWMDATRHGAGHFYYHPFGAPFPGGYDVTPYWLEQRASGMPFSDVSTSVTVAEALRSPKRIASPPYQGEVEYAYHVNAHKFAQLLARNAMQRFGVQHKSATIVGAERAQDGSIAGLRLQSGGLDCYDFYVDCSGFASVLLDQALAVPFVDKSRQILSDTALVQQVPFDPSEDIKPYTHATAHAAGWIWDIPVTYRRGTGFVYSSAHLSDDQAAAQFAQYLGLGDSAFAPRKIAMKIGYRQQYWSHNCVALGLAQGFVEPLEATSILLTDFSADLFARNFPRQRGDIPVLQKHCNEVVAYTWERIIDFVQLHYLLSDRSDSAFWLDNRHPQHISDVLQERLDRWRLGHPKKSDFFSRFDLFDVDNYLYVLYGMQYPTRGALMSGLERAEYQRQIDATRQHAAALVQQLPRHRDWLAGLRQALAAQA